MQQSEDKKAMSKAKASIVGGILFIIIGIAVCLFIFYWHMSEDRLSGRTLSLIVIWAVVAIGGGKMLAKGLKDKKSLNK